MSSAQFSTSSASAAAAATTPDRGSPCLALIHGGKLFLFGAGEGSFRKLVCYGLPVLRLERIFITHLIPPVPDNDVARRAFTAGMDDAFKGELTVASDGMAIDLE